jgi:hypothetical protein
MRRSACTASSRCSPNARSSGNGPCRLPGSGTDLTSAARDRGAGLRRPRFLGAAPGRGASGLCQPRRQLLPLRKKSSAFSDLHWTPSRNFCSFLDGLVLLLCSTFSRIYLPVRHRFGTWNIRPLDVSSSLGRSKNPSPFQPSDRYDPDASAGTPVPQLPHLLEDGVLQTLLMLSG